MSDYLKQRMMIKQYGKPEKIKKTYRLKRSPIKRKYHRIKKRSDKLSAEDVLYFQKREVFLKKHTRCQCGRNGCNRLATDIHHKKGRGKYYLVVKYWLAVARVCHNWIGANHEEAKRLGLVLDRLKK